MAGAGDLFCVVACPARGVPAGTASAHSLQWRPLMGLPERHVLLGLLLAPLGWLAWLVQFNSPYPSRTPKLSQWSDRPRRVGLGPQFLSRGSLTVRDSVVSGRRWGFILCGCLSSTWCAHWTAFCSQIAGEAIACHLPAPRSKYFGHRCFLLCGPEWHPANDQ